MKRIPIIMLLAILLPITLSAQERGRARDFGIEPGILSTGTWNAITDVDGVKVGHKTLISGEHVRTGVTVILPHEGNMFQEKVPAAVSVGNGFGKALGFTQVQELGNLETPIALTNTLNVFSVAESLVEYMLSLPGNEEVRSVNPVAGETNDGWLNDIRGRHVSKNDVMDALAQASGGAVREGNVGAGTGTLCMGFKGGIGSSSRVLSESQGGYTVGVLVQTNFGGILHINGAPVGEALDRYYKADKADGSTLAEAPNQAGIQDQVNYQVDGSCMIVVATDAPLSSRNLERLAKRSFLALGRVGSFMSNGSGDYAIAFSTQVNSRIPHSGDHSVRIIGELENRKMSPLFLAVVEATEEAIYNSLFMAEDMVGQKQRSMPALPIQKSLDILDRHGARSSPAY